jgi:hypothetical protein
LKVSNSFVSHRVLDTSKAFRIVTAMPVVLLKTASKHLQVARQRLSDSFSDLKVSRVSSFDSYSSHSTPHIGENGVRAMIVEGSNELEEDARNGVKHVSQTNSNVLTSRRAKREKSLSYTQFMETLSPSRIVEFFRVKEDASPMPSMPKLSRSTTEGKKTPSSISFSFTQTGRRSSDSLMSDDRDEMPTFPSFESKATPSAIALLPKPDEDYIKTERTTSAAPRVGESQNT